MWVSTSRKKYLEPSLLVLDPHPREATARPQLQQLHPAICTQAAGGWLTALLTRECTIGGAESSPSESGLREKKKPTHSGCDVCGRSQLGKPRRRPGFGMEPIKSDIAPGSISSGACTSLHLCFLSAARGGPTEAVCCHLEQTRGQAPGWCALAGVCGASWPASLFVCRWAALYTRTYPRTYTQTYTRACTRTYTQTHTQASIQTCNAYSLSHVHVVCGVSCAGCPFVGNRQDVRLRHTRNMVQQDIFGRVSACLHAFLPTCCDVRLVLAASHPSAHLQRRPRCEAPPIARQVPPESRTAVCAPAAKLRAVRVANGALELSSGELRFSVDPVTGQPCSVEAKQKVTAVWGTLPDARGPAPCPWLSSSSSSVVPCNLLDAEDRFFLSRPDLGSHARAHTSAALPPAGSHEKDEMTTHQGQAPRAPKDPSLAVSLPPVCCRYPCMCGVCPLGSKPSLRILPRTHSLRVHQGALFSDSFQ